MAQEKEFSWNASDYAEHSAIQQKWAKELIAKLHLSGDETILDIGCGDGKVTAELAKAVATGKVIGVDNSQSMLDLASRKFSQERYPNLSFSYCDAANLHFNEKFDVIFSNAALHWINNHSPVIAGISRALKPGGRILLQMGGKGNAASILSTIERVIQHEKYSRYFHDFNFSYGFHGVKEYREWLEIEGLQALRVELLDKDMTYPCKSGLAGWIRTTWLPYTTPVPEPLRAEFIEDLVNHYWDDFPPDQRGDIHVGMKRLEVEAVKIS